MATGAEAVVVEGSNTVRVTDSHLTGTKNRGVMIYQSFSGDAQGQEGRFSETGGSLSALDGPLFFVTNTDALIELTDTKLSETSGVLLDAAASAWGTSGSNGGNVTLRATHEVLSGAVTVDDISTAVLELNDGTVLTGSINAAGSAKGVTVVLDKTSKWYVTADSYLTVLEDSANLTGSKVSNIIGDGHTVYYDKSANTSLGGKSYSLVGGGTLKPA